MSSDIFWRMRPLEPKEFIEINIGNIIKMTAYCIIRIRYHQRLKYIVKYSVVKLLWKNRTKRSSQGFKDWVILVCPNNILLFFRSQGVETLTSVANNITRKNTFHVLIQYISEECTTTCKLQEIIEFKKEYRVNWILFVHT